MFLFKSNLFFIRKLIIHLKQYNCRFFCSISTDLPPVKARTNYYYNLGPKTYKLWLQREKEIYFFARNIFVIYLLLKGVNRMPEKNLCVPFVGPLGISFTFYRFAFYVFHKKVERNFFPCICFNSTVSHFQRHKSRNIYSLTTTLYSQFFFCFQKNAKSRLTFWSLLHLKILDSSFNITCL